eukprot:433890_1
MCNIGGWLSNATILNDSLLQCPVDLMLYQANTTVNVYLESYYFNVHTSIISSFKLGETEKLLLLFKPSPVVYSNPNSNVPIDVSIHNITITGKHFDTLDYIEIMGSDRLTTRTVINSANQITVDILSESSIISGYYDLSMILSSSETGQNIQVYDSVFSIFTGFEPVIHTVIPAHSVVDSKIYIRNDDKYQQFNFSNTIICKYNLEIEDQNGNTELFDTNGSWINPQLISCITPNIKMQTINVSVSFDNVTYSNTLFIYIISTPSVINISPTNKVYPSQNIQFIITGSNFIEPSKSELLSSCQFEHVINGDIKMSRAMVMNSNILSCYKPNFINSTDGNYTISVTFDGLFFYEIDDTLLEVSLTYSPPVCDSFIGSNFGDDESGVSISINGSYFRSDSTRCEYTIYFENFNNNNVWIQNSYITDYLVNTTVVSDTHITCILPSYDEIFSQSDYIEYNTKYVKHTVPKSRRRIYIKTVNEFNESGNSIGLWYEYRSTPFIYSFYPHQVFDTSPNDINIIGYNFIYSFTLKCKFVSYTDNSTLSIVSATFINYKNIICTLPVMQPAKIQIAVSNNAIDYTYYTNVILNLLISPLISYLTPSITNSIITEYVTVVGSNFEYPFIDSNIYPICRFDGQYLIGDVIIVNNTHLLCPLASLQSTFNETDNYNYTLEVSFDGGSNYIIAPEIFTFVATQNTPFITHIYPTFGPRYVITPVYVEGNAFLGGIYCIFGDGDIITGTVINDTLAICYAGTFEFNEITEINVQISRYSDRDFCCNAMFTFHVIPMIILSHLLPSAVFERSTLTIINDENSGELTEPINVYGKHFYFSSELCCKFIFEDENLFPEIVIRNAIYQTSNHITCLTPHNRAVGNYYVFISNDGVNFGDSSLKFTVLPIITITSIYPTYGNVMGGFFVTLTGSGFNSTYDIKCIFDNSYFIDAIYIDDQHINCSVPTHNPGTIDISLAHNYQKVSEINNINIKSFAFTYVSTMRIDSLHPTTGRLRGGTNITMAGHNFINQTDGSLALELKCRFKTSTKAAKAIMFEYPVYTDAIVSQDGTQLFCQTPARTFAGFVTIEIEATNGEITTQNKLFKYYDEIYLDYTVPTTSRTTGGDIITIYGNNFEFSPINWLQCLFSLSNASLSTTTSLIVIAKWISETEIKCNAPDFAIADLSSNIQYEAYIQISNNNGIEWSDNIINITYRNDLLINATTISPVYGPSTGTEITVTGVNFPADKQIACQFGNDKFRSIAHVISNVLLTCHAPSVMRSMVNDSWSVQFILVSEEEILFPSNINFTYCLLPLLHMVHPTEGPYLTYNGSMGNLLITGSNLPTLSGLITVCRWTRIYIADGTFDYRISSYTLTNATVLNSNELICDIPEPTEKVESYYSIEFSFNLHDYTLSNLMYRFYEPIQLYNISPNITPNTSNEHTIQLIANRIPFWREINCWLEFDTSYRVNVTRINQWKFWCVIPNQPAPSTVSICAGIYDMSYDCMNMTYILPAELYSIEPTYGLIHGHTNVTIKGHRFYDSVVGIFFKIYNEEYNFTSTVEALYIDDETVILETHVVEYPGVYQYSMTLNRQSFTSSVVNFTYVVSSEIISVTPHNVMSTGETILSVIGENYPFQQTKDVYCILFFDGIYYFKIKGILSSQTNVTCNMPDFSPYTIETCNEIISIMLTFNNQSTTAMARQLHIVPPFNFTYVNPINVQIFHVTKVYITGHSIGYDKYINVTEELYCRWNGTIFTKAEYWNQTTIRCDTPNFTENALNELTLTFNLQQYSSPIYIYSYSRIILDSLTPDNVVHEGGSFVIILGTGFVESDYLKCRFDDFYVVPAEFINSSCVKCIIIPNVKQTQNVSIKVSNNAINYDGDINNGPLFVEYLTPRIYYVHPSTGAAFGGTVLHIQGGYFKNTSYLHVYMICDQIDTVTGDYIQAKIVPFSYVNSTYMLIYTAAIVIDTAQKQTTCHLEVTNNGQDYSRNGAVFNYYTLLIESFLPLSGSVDGGTQIIMNGFGFQNRSELNCLFHNNVTSQAYMLEQDRLTCNTPAFSDIFPNFDYTHPNVLPINVTLEITNNLLDYTSQEMTFIYEMRPSIISISPSSSVGNSITQIIVNLNNSNNYIFNDYDNIGGQSGAYCKFDDHV